jgi:hypothetical protein
MDCPFELILAWMDDKGASIDGPTKRRPIHIISTDYNGPPVLFLLLL